MKGTKHMYNGEKIIKETKNIIFTETKTGGKNWYFKNRHDVIECEK
jgi:hypothetical protein